MDPNQEFGNSSLPPKDVKVSPEECPAYPEKTISSILSWSVIVLAVVTLAGLVYLNQVAEKQNLVQGEGGLFQLHTSSKVTHGFHYVMKKLYEDPENKDKESKAKLKESAELLDKQNLNQINTGSIASRMTAAILEADFNGMDAGLEVISDTEKLAKNLKYSLSDIEIELIDCTKRAIYQMMPKDQRADSDTYLEVKPSHYENLKTRMGFAGEVAKTLGKDDEAPSKKVVIQTSSATTTKLLLLGTLVFLAVVAGTLIVSPICFIALCLDKFKILFAHQSRGSFLYLEAFAVWILAHILTSIFVPISLHTIGLPLNNLSAEMRLVASILMFSLPVVISYLWLRKRHHDTREMNKAIGFCSHGFSADIFRGIVTYLACLPIFGLGILSVVILQWIFGQEPTSAFDGGNNIKHPIQDQLFSDSWIAGFSIVFMAAIAAPIVEEIVFRGYFYRYLRDISGKNSRLVSVLFSVCVNGFIFAAIHPQGILAIPALMSLGIIMCLAREWREGLVAPMTVHALHNGTISMFMLSFM